MTVPDRRVVAITGANTGIGLAIATRFAHQGCDLALAYWPDAGATEQIGRIAAGKGAEVFGQQGDFRDRGQAHDFVTAAVARFGRLDVLVTNAGVHRAGAAVDVSWDHWDEMIAVNLTATFACIRAALPQMLAQRSGVVVTISSELALAGAAEMSAYVASKGGVIGLTKSLGRELAPFGIRVNSVAPGPTLTDMLRRSPEFVATGPPDIPLKRYGSPEEVAEVVEFLAGTGGSLFIGQVVSPNGGTVI